MAVGRIEPGVQEAVAALLACARECRSCAQACQSDAEAFGLAECIALAQDCAEICALGADLLRRHSRFRAQMCSLCAEACIACAAECARNAELDPCRECEEKCRRCARACHSLSEPPF